MIFKFDTDADGGAVIDDIDDVDEVVGDDDVIAAAAGVVGSGSGSGSPLVVIARLLILS